MQITAPPRGRAGSALGHRLKIDRLPARVASVPAHKAKVAACAGSQVRRALEIAATLSINPTLDGLYNIALPATNLDDSPAGLLRAYLDAVTLSEALQTRIWHTAELTLVQVRVLRRLARQPQSLGQLGTELALAPPSMTRLVDRLEERGLIERGRDLEDRRKVVATITDKGKRLVSAIPFLDGTAIRVAVDRMKPADRDRIAAALREFNSAVRQVEDELLMAVVET